MNTFKGSKFILKLDQDFIEDAVDKSCQCRGHRFDQPWLEGSMCEEQLSLCFPTTEAMS